MYIYQSPDFESKAQNPRIASRIQRIIKDLESAQKVNSNNVPRFPGRYGSRYLKHEENAFRIVAELLTIDDVQVIYLHTIYEHGRDYDWFIGEIKAGRFPFEPDMNNVCDFVQQQKAEENSRMKAAQAPRQLPEGFEGWLKRPEWDANDWVIYEGQEWVSRFRKDEFKDRWETLCEIVEGIVGYAEENGVTSNPISQTYGNVRITPINGFKTILQAQNKDRFVLFSIHQVDVHLDDDNPARKLDGECERGFSRRIIFLLAPFDHSPHENDISNLVQDTYPFYNNEESFELTFNDIARVASRVYPCYIPLDPELWEDIEKEEGVNLALSAEEEKILFSLSSAGPNEYRLPIFINGRAGSGKSTILFYLFAEYCYRLLCPKNSCQLEELGLNGKPLFLTYNQELLKVAKDRVKRMLKTRLLINDPQQYDELDEQLTPMLKPFREFLRELLPDNEEYEKFMDDSKRITFHEFKQLFSRQFHNQEAKKYSPDLCWYVIRTYIKGYSLDGYLDLEQYDTVFQKDRIIPSGDFEKISSMVWKWYSRYIEDNGLWDDQDLIRAVLDNGVDPSEDYTAIFCDEAQDFTKLELHFILQSSVFSKFDLSNYNQAVSLPFAFAGDPLQTLNPTGFRWAKVQAMFHKEIIESVDPLGRLELRIKPLDDLVYNYRSTKPIVETTNAVLLLRNYLFDQDTKPQSHWGKGSVSFVPQKFILEQIDLNVLKKSIQDTIILVPCDEGGEFAFIQNDPQLSQLFQDASEENRPRNVLSAIGAKGLEFQRVILYKFGEYCPQRIWRGEFNSGQRVEAEYFFNKLYVAATRATKWLFVLESIDGDRNLWEHLNEQELIGYGQSRKDSETWSVRPTSDTNPANIYTVRTISVGTREGLQEISEAQPELVAKEFKDKGIAAGNPDYLRRAKNYYLSLNDQLEAEFCEAYALKIEGKLSQAGHRFLKISKVDYARDCFWDGELWKDLLELQGEIKREEVTLAHFMISKRDDPKIILDFTKFLENCIEKNTLGKSVNKQWKNVLSEFRQRIFALTSKSLTEENWHQLGTILEELTDRGFQDIQGATGKCYFNANSLKKAILVWEATGATSHKEYYQAKAMQLTYPSNLEWWEKSGDHERIYQEWQQLGGLEKQLEPREVRYIGPILEDKQRYWDACQVYMRVSDPDIKKIVSLLGKIKNFTPKMVANRDEVNVLINYLCSHDQWSALLILMEKIFVPIKESKEQSEIRYMLIKNLSKANVSDDLTEPEVVKQIYHNIIRPVRTDRNWQSSLSLESDFGPAVERLGFDMSLRFYETLVNEDMLPSQRDFARMRWLANAEKKVEYIRQKGEEVRDLKLLRDLSQRKKNWVFLSPTTAPLITDERTKGKDAIIAAFSPIQGLPPDIKVVAAGEGQMKFRIDDIEYTVHKTKQIVTLEDGDVNRVRLDLNTQQIRSGEIDVIQQNTPEGRIFSIPSWHMGGKIQENDGHVVLEIACNKLTSPFTIQL